MEENSYDNNYWAKLRQGDSTFKGSLPLKKVCGKDNNACPVLILFCMCMFQVRKVDTPKDQMDKEWEEFQKAMRQINTVSYCSLF